MSSNPQAKIKLAHGTTTLAFRFQGGIIVAVDSRATAGSYIGMLSARSRARSRLMWLSEWNGQESYRDQPIPSGNNGGRSSRLSILVSWGWWLFIQVSWLMRIRRETYLGMQCRLHELRNKERISVAAASKILANIVYQYKGRGLSMVRTSL
jgi:20S proteasome subunit beta 5